jgi:prepilin-type N-terminal cleavage/methylation domain-containing protein
MRHVWTAGSAAPAAPPGFTLVEVMAAMTLLGAATALIYGSLAAQVRLARAASERAAAAEAVRTASHVVAGEIRRMTATDVAATSADSMAVRAFRGIALVCGSGGDRITVRYRGDRLPDPAKDSVVAVDDTEQRTAHLAESRPAITGACLPEQGERVLDWRIAPPLDSAGVLLVFERGSYYISARALRYRRGAEGRQPLTAELIRHPPSRFDLDDGVLTLHLAAGRLPHIRIRAVLQRDPAAAQPPPADSGSP